MKCEACRVIEYEALRTNLKTVFPGSGLLARKLEKTDYVYSGLPRCYSLAVAPNPRLINKTEEMH